jgi:hypothetical protein
MTKNPTKYESYRTNDLRGFAFTKDRKTGALSKLFSLIYVGVGHAAVTTTLFYVFLNIISKKILLYVI